MDTWSPHPCVDSNLGSIERFRAFANNLQPSCSHEDYLSLAMPLADLAADPEVVVSQVRDSLVRIRADETYQSTHWGEHSVVLATDRHWQLVLGLYTRSSEHIYSFPFHFMGAAVGCRTLQADLYRLPAEYDGEVFAPGATAALVRHATYRPGDVFTVDSRREAFDVCIAEPVLALKFIMTPFMQLQWTFDRRTLKSMQAIASNPLHSELVTICMTLKAMKRTGSDALLDRLSRHPAHFVRWAAIQGLGSVNPKRARERLEQSMTDEHPHIRRAAAKHLSLSK